MQHGGGKNAPSTMGGRGSLPALRWLGAMGAAVTLGVLAFGAAVLLDARRDAWDQAERASANLALALERDIARNLAVYDLSIQGTIAALREPGLEQASPEVRHRALFDRTTGAEYLGSLLVLDPNGDVLASSTSLTPPALNLADRDYFRVHQERPNAGLFVSRPFRSRLRGGDASMAISRRVDGPDGQFGGVIVGSLRLAYLQDLFGRLDLGPRGGVTLFRTDGRIMARHPYREAEIDRDLSGATTFQRFMTAPSGTFVGRGALDGVRRLYSFRHVDGLPLLLSVAVSVDAVFSAWWSKAVAIGGMLVVLCSAMVALCLLFRREMLNRLAAEEALTEAAHKLELAANTDGLTGLSNRRRFDEALQTEWRRSARERTPLSLLLLDVDRFKAFNDRYGHQAGDDCLRAVAAAVGACARRPGDLAARYGGEELAMVLPGTDEEGAAHLAELVRSAVEALGLQHEDNGECGGVVTVSVGCATLSPQPISSPDTASRTLLKEADRMLYEAKRGGRNRVAALAREPDPALHVHPA